MSWPPEQRRAEDVSWTLQVQYKRGGWWSDHTSGLHPRQDADALKAERQAANPKLRYRLVRVTETRTIERPQ